MPDRVANLTDRAAADQRPPRTMLSEASLICFAVAALLAGGGLVLYWAFEVPPIPVCAAILCGPLGLVFALAGLGVTTESTQRAWLGLMVNLAFCVAWAAYFLVQLAKLD